MARNKHSKADGVWNSSASGPGSTFNSEEGTGPERAGTSGRWTDTATSSPNVSGPTDVGPLTLQDFLLILQEDLRNLQRMGLDVVVVNLPEKQGVGIGVYGPVRFIRGNLRVTGEASE